MSHPSTDDNQHRSPNDHPLATLAVVALVLLGGTLAVAIGSATAEPAPEATVEAAQFEVTITDTNSPVASGDTVVVETTVENTGDESAEQNVTLAIEGTIQDQAAVDLAPGETETVELTWQTNADDAGNYGATVESADDADSTEVVVDPDLQSHFSVAIAGTNSPVVEGEPIEVTAQVTNEGSAGGEQSIELDLGAGAVDQTPVALAAGESTEVTLSVPTEAGDAGTYEATVSSEDDADSDVVDVLAEDGEADFEVDIQGTTSPVIQGETLEVTATVTNTGNESGEQPIELAVDHDDAVDDVQSTSLAAGENTTITLAWDTEGVAPGSYEATVSSDDDADSVGVEVQQPATFDVEIVETDSPAAPGEVLAVSATVTNLGDEADTQPVHLAIGDEVVDQTEVDLAGGASEEITLEWQTDADDVGNHTASVEREDDADSIEVTVQDGPFFEVDIVSTNGPLEEGHELVVTAEVTNTGGTADEQEIQLLACGDTVGSPVELNESESTLLERSLVDPNCEPGERTVTVASEDDEDETTVSILASAHFAVEIIDASADGDAGPELTVRVTNEGDVEDTQTIQYLVDGEVHDSTDVTLAGGESVTLTFAGGSDNNSELFNLTTESEDDSDDTSVSNENEPPDPGTVQVTPTAGESVTVDPEASDPDGEITAYEWRVNGESVAETGTLEYMFDEPGEYELELIVTDDDGASASAVETIHVEADDKGLPLVPIGLGVIGLALAGGVYYASRRRGMGQKGTDKQQATSQAELIDSISSEAGVAAGAGKKAVDAFIDTTTKALKKGNRVWLVGWGSFIVAESVAPDGEGPGEEDTPAAKKVVKFKPGAELSNEVEAKPPDGEGPGEESTPAAKKVVKFKPGAELSNEVEAKPPDGGGSDTKLSDWNQHVDEIGDSIDKIKTKLVSADADVAGDVLDSADQREKVTADMHAGSGDPGLDAAVGEMGLEELNGHIEDDIRRLEAALEADPGDDRELLEEVLERERDLKETVAEGDSIVEAMSGDKGENPLYGEAPRISGEDLASQADIGKDEASAVLEALPEGTASGLNETGSVDLGDLGSLHLETGEGAPDTAVEPGVVPEDLGQDPGR